MSEEKKQEGRQLTRPAKLAMIRALAAGNVDEEGEKALLEFFDHRIDIRLIDSRLLVPGITQAEFETAVMQIRREQFGRKN